MLVINSSEPIGYMHPVEWHSVLQPELVNNSLGYFMAVNYLYPNGDIIRGHDLRRYTTLRDKRSFFLLKGIIDRSLENEFFTTSFILGPILNKHFAPHLIDPSEYSYARVYRTEEHRRGGYLPIVSEIVLGELGDEREICIDSSKKNITLVQWAKKWFLGIEQTSIEERILNLKPNI